MIMRMAMGMIIIMVVVMRMFMSVIMPMMMAVFEQPGAHHIYDQSHDSHGNGFVIMTRDRGNQTLHRLKNRYWSSIPIKRRMIDKLVINCAVDRFPDLEIIIDFGQFFQPVSQRAISGQYSQPSCSEKLAMHIGNSVNSPCHAQSIIRTTP